MSLKLKLIMAETPLERSLEILSELAKEDQLKRETKINEDLANALHYAICTIDMLMEDKRPRGFKKQVKDISQTFWPAYKALNFAHCPATKSFEKFLKNTTSVTKDKL